MAWVLSSLTGFFQRRRRALVLATSVVGGAYVVGKYAVDRIRDTQQRLVAERRDKENLRRRFAQNQDDCTFTTLALLPALAAQILAALNVEDLTAALQRRKRAPPQPQPQPVQPIHQPRHPESHLEQTGGPTEQDGSSSQQPGGSKQSAAPTLAAPAPAQNGAHLPPSGLPGAEAERPADLTDSAQIAKAHPVGGADGEHARAGAQQTAADAALDQDQAASPAQEPKPPQPVLPDTTAAAMRNAPMLTPTPTPAHPHDPASDPPERSGSTAEEPDFAVLQAHPALPAAGAASEASRVAESNDSLDEPTAKGDSGADVGGPTSASVEETPPQVNGAAPEQVHDASVKGESNHSSPNRPHGERQNREEEVEEEKEVEVEKKMVVAVQQQEQQENEEEAPLSAEERARLEAATAAAKAEAAARAEAEREAVEEAKMRERQETLALWNELKVVSLSQAVTSVYGIVLLTLQTHIMLNLIGRYSYLASVVSMGERPPQDAEGMEDEALEAAFDAAERMDSPPAPADRDDDGSGTGAGPGAGIDPHTERLYLTFSWWLLHRGWDRLAQRVRGAVESTFGQLSIMSPLSWHDFDRLLRSVRRKVEYDVLPPLEQEAYAANFSFGFGDDLHSSALSEVSGTTRGSRRLLAKRRTYVPTAPLLSCVSAQLLTQSRTPHARKIDF